MPEVDKYRAHATPIMWYVYHRESGEYLDEVSARTAFYAWVISSASALYAYSQCSVVSVKL